MDRITGQSDVCLIRSCDGRTWFGRRTSTGFDSVGGRTRVKSSTRGAIRSRWTFGRLVVERQVNVGSTAGVKAQSREGRVKDSSADAIRQVGHLMLLLLRAARAIVYASVAGSSAVSIVRRGIIQCMHYRTVW